jgi:PilZ domain
MNDYAQPRGPNKRLFDGRIEKRVPTSVPVYLGALEDPRRPERTVTENVSPHGARVISKRSWRPGDESIVTPLSGEFPQVGRVIYCLPSAGDRFCLGMEFLDRAVNWGDSSAA